VSHIKLTNRDRKDSTKSVLWVDPKAISFIEETEEGEAALCLSFSSEEYLTVTETPAEIADKFESARREERIRENAARFMAHGIFYNIQFGCSWTVQTGSALDAAMALEKKIEDHFAAERARKEGEKP